MKEMDSCLCFTSCGGCGTQPHNDKHDYEHDYVHDYEHDYKHDYKHDYNHDYNHDYKPSRQTNHRNTLNNSTPSPPLPTNIQQVHPEPSTQETTPNITLPRPQEPSLSPSTRPCMNPTSPWLERIPTPSLPNHIIANHNTISAYRHRHYPSSTLNPRLRSYTPPVRNVPVSTRPTRLIVKTHRHGHVSQ